MIFRIKENMMPALMFHIMRLKFIHSSSKGSEKNSLSTITWGNIQKACYLLAIGFIPN